MKCLVIKSRLKAHRMNVVIIKLNQIYCNQLCILINLFILYYCRVVHFR